MDRQGTTSAGATSKLKPAAVRVLLVAFGFLAVDVVFLEWPGRYEIILQVLLLFGFASAQLAKALRPRRKDRS